MPRPRFRDDQWERIYTILRGCPGKSTSVRMRAPRRFVEAVLWMARAGCAWRLVPGAVGSWNSVYKRFARWQEKGVWAALMDQLAADADLEWAMLDSTVVRAHACAAGAKKSPGEQALGRSRGGFSKQAAWSRRRPGQPAGLPPDRRAAGRRPASPAPARPSPATTAVIADKAYDTDAILRGRGGGRSSGGDPAQSHPQPPTPDRLASLPAAAQDREPVRLHEALPPRSSPASRNWRAAISPSSISSPLASCCGSNNVNRTSAPLPHRTTSAHCNRNESRSGRRNRGDPSRGSPRRVGHQQFGRQRAGLEPSAGRVGCQDHRHAIVHAQRRVGIGDDQRVGVRDLAGCRLVRLGPQTRHEVRPSVGHAIVRPGATPFSSPASPAPKAARRDDAALALDGFPRPPTSLSARALLSG